MIQVKVELLFSLAVALRGVQGACYLCPQNLGPYATFGPHPAKSNWYIGQGLTCSAAYLAATTDSAKCNNLKAYAQECCSAPGLEGGRTQAPQMAPPTLPPEARQVGNEPVCHLCQDGRQPPPSHQNNVIHSNFLPGSPTCYQTWQLGLDRMIGGAVCYPLQLFARSVCGCDVATSPTPPSPTPPSPSPPSPTPPSPTPPTSEIPERKPRPSSTNKNNLKLSNLYRSRGSTNNRQLKGEDPKDDKTENDLEIALHSGGDAEVMDYKSNQKGKSRGQSSSSVKTDARTPSLATTHNKA